MNDVIFNLRIETCGIGVVPATESLVRVALGLNEYQVHPCGTALGVETGCLDPVGAVIAALNRIVEALDVPEGLTLAP